MIMKQKIHTGCSCINCRKGKNKKTRNFFHRMMRNIYKRELKDEGEIKTVDKSIGYTD